MSKIIRVRYEKGLLKPLDEVKASEGEILIVKIIRRELAEKVYGSIRVDKKVLEEVLKEAEDELGIY